MRTIFCAIIGLVCGALPVTGELLVNTDFGAFPRPPEYKIGEANPNVKGVLPEGWLDDSAWAPVWLEYGFGDEQGLRFLRMNATRIDEGRPQLTCYPIADVKGERLYRLQIQVRNLTGAPVEMGIRMREKPWKFYWHTNDTFSPNWDTYTYEFRLDKNDDQSMGIWFNLNALGRFEIAKVRLERFSNAEIMAEIKRAYPDGGPANLFRNTRFPLGLQNGWAIGCDNSDGDVVTVQADSSVVGPSGAPALVLSSPEHVVLRSEPFAVVYPMVEHWVCVAIRGRGDWQLVVFGPGAGAESTTVTLDGGNAWQRIHVAFKPNIRMPFYQFRIEGAGEMFMDALQAGPSAKCATYIPPGDCEVALTIPKSDASIARIQFDDEPATIHWCVTGKPENAVLKAKVVNVFGAEKFWPDTVLKNEFVQNGTLVLSQFPEAPLGSFRIEAWVERDGKGISPVNELVVHRLRRPRYWGRDAPNSAFGVHTNSTMRHNTMAKAVGINWTRLHDAGLQYFGWCNLEPEKGEWQFHDRELKRFRACHIKIFAELGTAPKWASYYQDTGRKTFGYFDRFFQPRDLDDYRNYVKVVCTRYKGVIDAFDVWNEPWIHAWWGVAYDHEKGGRAGYLTSQEPQKDFVALMQAANDTAKSVIPDCRVLGFNTTTSKGGGTANFSGEQWTRGVLEHGGLQHCDGIAYHGYTGGGVGYPGDTIETGLANALGPIREQLGSVPKPVWMTEGSPLIHRMANGIYKHTLPFENKDKVMDSANRIARYLISLRANNVEKIFLYSMHAHGAFRLEPKQWNALTTDEGYLHPCGAAHAHTAWLLEDTRFVKRVELGEPGVFAYLFQGAGRAVVAISSSPGPKHFPIPRAPGVTVTGLFGNPWPVDAVFEGRIVYLEAKKASILEKLF